METGKPIFGICLGHQMLGLALGGTTAKMHQGHHGANHPVKDLTTGKVEITSMNHGFAVDQRQPAGRRHRRPMSRCSTARMPASRSTASRSFRCSTTPRPRPARTTAIISSRASSIRSARKRACRRTGARRRQLKAPRRGGGLGRRRPVGHCGRATITSGRRNPGRARRRPVTSCPRPDAPGFRRGRGLGCRGIVGARWWSLPSASCMYSARRAAVLVGVGLVERLWRAPDGRPRLSKSTQPSWSLLAPELGAACARRRR